MTSNELYEVEIKKLLIEIREKETELHALKSVKSSVNHELVEAKTYICKLQQKIIYDQEKATKEQTKAMEQFQTAKEEVCELKKTVQVEKDAKKALTNKLRHAVRLRKAYYAELKALKEGNPAKKPSPGKKILSSTASAFPPKHPSFASSSKAPGSYFAPLGVDSDDSEDIPLAQMKNIKKESRTSGDMEVD